MCLRLCAVVAFVVPGACSASSNGNSEGRGADLIIHGGSIYTGDDANPKAEAVAAADGVVIAVGDHETVSAFRHEATRVVNLNGATMFPGFTDSHVHLLMIGQRELTLDLVDVDSIAELVSIVEAKVSQAQRGQVIFGAGWIETGWPEGRFPTRADIDPVSPHNPVILYREDRHALLANSAALETAGITNESVDPKGGRIERDAAGHPTGILIDTAMRPVAELVDTPSPVEKEKLYALASDHYAAHGWTAVHSMLVDPSDLPMIETLSANGDILIRVYNALHKSGLKALVREGEQISDNGRVVTRGVKLLMDGALGSRGAVLSAPYADQFDTNGLLLMEKREALDYFKTALQSGIQISTHAIGDRANKLVLDWYAEAFAAIPPENRNEAEPRWRIEHASLLHGEDIARFAELGVIASVQPSFVDDFHFAPSRLGSDRLDRLYPWRSLIEAGAVVAAGSDAPIERGKPMLEFYAAVTRAEFNGHERPDWHPEQAVSRAEALKMLTLWPAYASFQDHQLGTIAVGKRADFSVFSKDIMTSAPEEILDTEAVMTVVDGNIIFQSDDVPKLDGDDLLE